MKTNIACVVGALIATISISIAAPDKEAIIAKEKAVWKAFRDKDADAVKKLVSTDVVAVYPDGIYNFQQRMDGMSKDDDEIVFLERFQCRHAQRGYGHHFLQGESGNQRGRKR